MVCAIYTIHQELHNFEKNQVISPINILGEKKSHCQRANDREYARDFFPSIIFFVGKACFV